MIIIDYNYAFISFWLQFYVFSLLVDFYLWYCSSFPYSCILATWLNFVIVICLDPLDLHIQIPRPGPKWSHPPKIRLSLVSRQISSGPRARFSPFVSRDLHPTREPFCIFVVPFCCWAGCDEKIHVKCNVLSYSVMTCTCTLCWHVMDITLGRVLWSLLYFYA